MIDRSERLWRGASFTDLDEYVRLYTAENYPAAVVAQSVCLCGSTGFGLEVDDDEGCAQRKCLKCLRTAFIGDSGEYWDDAEPGGAACPCGSEQFELGVGFSLREDGDVRWITVGGRCLACGVLGVYVDWKIDYSPTEHLLKAT